MMSLRPKSLVLTPLPGLPPQGGRGTDRPAPRMSLSRRNILAGLAAVAGSSLLDISLANAEEQTMQTYEVDLAGLHDAFPRSAGALALDRRLRSRRGVERRRLPRRRASL